MRTVGMGAKKPADDPRDKKIAALTKDTEELTAKVAELEGQLADAKKPK